MALLVNGEVVQLSEPADETEFEITGANPEYRLTETDQADPAGRFRWRVEGDQLLIQRAGSAAWATATTIITLDGPSASVVSPVLTTPQINDTSADHQYVFAVSELTADRIVTLPLLGAGDTFVFEGHAQTLTSKTLTSPVLTTPQINDTSSDHQYIFAVSELAADRTVTLPLLGAADTFVFESHSQATKAALEAETNQNTYAPPDLIKHSPGVAKGYCEITSAGLEVTGSFNVDGVDDIGTGNWRINWLVDFSSDNNSAVVSIGDDAVADNHSVQNAGSIAASTTITVRNSSGSLTDRATVCIAMGIQV